MPITHYEHRDRGTGTGGQGPCLVVPWSIMLVASLSFSSGISASTSLRQCVDWAWTDICLVSTLLPRG